MFLIFFAACHVAPHGAPFNTSISVIISFFAKTLILGAPKSWP